MLLLSLSLSNSLYDRNLLVRILSCVVVKTSLTLRPTVSRPVCPGIKHPPIWGLRPDFCYCQTVTGLLMWGALSLSDERTGLSFTIVVGPRQRSHFRVRVPWEFPRDRYLATPLVRWLLPSNIKHSSYWCVRVSRVFIEPLPSNALSKSVTVVKKNGKRNRRHCYKPVFNDVQSRTTVWSGLNHSRF
jgi:hypothetical protein